MHYYNFFYMMLTNYLCILIFIFYYIFVYPRIDVFGKMSCRSMMYPYLYQSICAT
jgi:hypothetical protein